MSAGSSAAVVDSAAAVAAMIDEAVMAEVMAMAMTTMITSIIRNPDDTAVDARSVSLASAFASSLEPQDLLLG
jgi:hypothetical protein